MLLVTAGRFSLFAKGGAARWRTETSIQHSMGFVARRSSDGVDAMYGFGAAFALKGSTGVRLEYERIATDAADRDFVSAGLHFKF
jgi:opacity protein-like surface antigen